MQYYSSHSAQLDEWPGRGIREGSRWTKQHFHAFIAMMNAHPPNRYEQSPYRRGIESKENYRIHPHTSHHCNDALAGVSIKFTIFSEFPGVEQVYAVIATYALTD